MPSHWTDYIDAAHRKIKIAEFHYEQLGVMLKQRTALIDSPPAISTQAFFEGVVVAVVSAMDQVAQSANSARNLGLRPDNLFNGASHEIEKIIPEFKDWREKPIGLDLRRLPTRMVHYSYIKSSNGELVWEVETANENYNGPRDLIGYAESAVSHARELGRLTDHLADAFQLDLT